VQKNQTQQDGQASQGRHEQQSQAGGTQRQQGGHNSQLTPSGGSNKQQSQSGGGRDQQGSNIKSDPGQAQSRHAQQGGQDGSRSDKQR